MTNNRIDIKQIKKLYRIIKENRLPDSQLDTRVNIVRYLEEVTGNDFKSTKDFHEKMERFLSSQSYTGNELKEARERKGWNQDALAFKLHTSRQYVGCMEKGTKPLNSKALRFIEENEM